MEIIDNFLPKEHFDKLEKIVMGINFPWYYQDQIAYKGENKESMEFYLSHLIYRDDKEPYPNSLEIVWPILQKLGSYKPDNKFLLRTLARVKVNCYPNQNKFIEHSWHEDFEPNTLPYKACLLSMNTCDGYTKFKDGTKIESVANRALLFDPCISHHSTNTTNQTRRVNININYL
tara:strand:- start:129 stop:653 length:525 start_codon:yes stop_codon:yes gene_type:complete